MDSETALVFGTFKASWDEFYTWKQSDAAASLLSLHRNVSRRGAEPTMLHSSPDPIEVHGTVSFNVEELHEYSGELKEQYSFASPPLYLDTVQPHPPYNSCTPANSNLLVGDDPALMPFVPFSDDTTFDHLRQTEFYKGFSWQTHTDPDLEVICVYTITKLTQPHGLTVGGVTATNALPTDVIQNALTQVNGRRRDYPKWPPDNPMQASRLPYYPSYINDSPRLQLASIIRYWCSNRNCLSGYCNIHTSEMPQPPAVPLNLSSADLHQAAMGPCSADCFVFREPRNSIPSWTKNDHDTLRLILKYAPDTLPCDLAVICRKPCNEVFDYRKRWSATQSTRFKNNEKPSSITPTHEPKFSDFDIDSFTPNTPCSHEGPCNDNVKCACCKNKAHCTGACKCSSHCLRKWRGCTCAKSQKGRTCRSDRCPCYKAHRECDPDFCLSCEARDPTSRICCNVSVQLGHHKKGFVSRSQWGLGYTLLEDAKKGDLISEYVGDIIYDDTVESRNAVAEHSGRQYMFKLNQNLTIDSTFAGNETRYINHTPNLDANVIAQVCLVNGEHRIGIFAAKTITAGTELFLDYGSEFFDKRPLQELLLRSQDDIGTSLGESF